MINANMRTYEYYTYGKQDAYGQLSLSSAPMGQIKMSINLTSQSIQDNINYQSAQYMGLTHAKVDDTFVIQYGKQQLKVLYVNSFGRLNQVFMAEL